MAELVVHIVVMGSAVMLGLALGFVYWFSRVYRAKGH